MVAGTTDLTALSCPYTLVPVFSVPLLEANSVQEEGYNPDPEAVTRHDRIDGS